MAQKYTCQAEVPTVVLGVAAHPDDLEAGAGGTIAAWTKQGAQVYYLILTSGAKGIAESDAPHQDLAEARRQEQREAARILGVADVFFCDHEDGLLTPSLDVKRDITRVIRQVRPDMVITMDPSMLFDHERGFINHPDHRAAGQATLDAVYPLARDHLSLPELFFTEKLKPHKVPAVLLMNTARPNCYIDITDTFDIKMHALAAHKSQFPSTHEAEDFLRELAGRRGGQSGVQYAEAYLRVDVREPAALIV